MSDRSYVYSLIAAEWFADWQPPADTIGDAIGRAVSAAIPEPDCLCHFADDGSILGESLADEYGCYHPNTGCLSVHFPDAFPVEFTDPYASGPV